MASSITDLKQPWQEWGIDEWNCALFEHFFHAPEGDTVPVSRLVINAEVLQQVAGDFRTARKEIRTGFRKAILARLKQSGRSLCADAIAAEWSSKPGQIPPYFAHLAVTCLAASGTGGSRTPKNDFRMRLNSFLDRGDDNARYDLGKLPRIWEMLSSWLNSAADAGRPYRRLVLRTQPSSIRLIGYSLDLSFPTHHEQRALVELFRGKGLTPSPPVLAVLRIVETGLDRFSQRFQQAFRQFYQSFIGGEKGLYQRPFWSAVWNAITTASLATEETDSSQYARVVVRLERDADWKFGLTIYLDKALERPLAHGLTSLSADDFAVGEFRFVLGRNNDANSEHSPDELLLSGSFRASVPELSTGGLLRAVEDGILLFVPDEEDVWFATFSLPYAATSIRALVRSDRAATVLKGLESVGAPVHTRQSRYAGWIEFDGFSDQHLREAKLATKFPNVLALQETIDAPKLVVRGGVRLPNGWLGKRAALPEFTIAPPGSVVTIEAAEQEEGRDSLPAPAIPDRPGVYTVPMPPDVPLDLDGCYLVRAKIGGTVLTARPIEFRSNVLSASYKLLTRPEDWLCEAGTSTLPLEGGTRKDIRVSVPLEEGAPFLSLLDDDSSNDVVGGPAPEVGSLTEILAGLSLRKRLIGAAELVDWFGRVLGIQGNLLWETVRAWVEAGVLDALVCRR